ncbi:MAG TPA: hypothetical protein VGJ15_10525, partial [Pirellulales bacterium]
MNEPINNSPQRSPTYYIGPCLIGIGFLLFISTFFSAAMNFGNFDHFEEQGRSMGLRAVSGMTLMIVGIVVSSISGTRAVRSQAGRIFEQAANALVKQTTPAPPPQPLHCPYCNTDNSPTLTNCQSCGAALVHPKRCGG